MNVNVCVAPSQITHMICHALVSYLQSKIAFSFLHLEKTLSVTNNNTGILLNNGDSAMTLNHGAMMMKMLTSPCSQKTKSQRKKCIFLFTNIINSHVALLHLQFLQ